MDKIEGAFHVGQVERIVLSKVVRVCACCGISVENCGCEHDTEYDVLSCVYRDSRKF